MLSQLKPQQMLQMREASGFQMFSRVKISKGAMLV